VIRVLPEGSRAVIERTRWEVPHVFRVLQRVGGIPTGDMFRTFNMGIGFAAIVAESDTDATLKAFESSDLEATVIGRVTEGGHGVEIR
jgi:phosphoribosylformylglycinamidine cyclo-ligase